MHFQAIFSLNQALQLDIFIIPKVVYSRISLLGGGLWWERPLLDQDRQNGIQAIKFHSLIDLFIVQSFIFKPNIDSWIILNQFMQTYNRQNFLKVCFDPCRGLKLNWNFKDISAQQQYFRHIFVVCCQRWNETIGFLESLYKKMKFGDLFCCFYAHDCSLYKKSRWVQKTQLNSFKVQRYFKQKSNRSLNQFIKTKMIDAAGRQAQEFDEPVIINFLGVDRDDLEFYKNQIIRHRNSKNPSYQYIVNLFGDFQFNHVSFHSGINLFKTDVSNFLDHADYYHKMVNAAVIQSAHIDISAGKGQLALFNEAYWKNTDFNTISATYYGPSSQFESENIFFFNREESSNSEHEFQVKLRIKLFQKKVLESNKCIKINFLQNKDYCPTYHDSRACGFYHQKNIFLSENPYKCDLIVKFKADKDQTFPDF